MRKIGQGLYVAPGDWECRLHGSIATTAELVDVRFEAHRGDLLKQQQPGAQRAKQPRRPEGCRVRRSIKQKDRGVVVRTVRPALCRRDFDHLRGVVGPDASEAGAFQRYNRGRRASPLA